MKINVFVKTYKTFKMKKSPEIAIHQVMIKDKILGYAEKLAVAQTIAKRVCFKPDGNFEINMATLSFHYEMELLRNYTNLEFSDDEIVQSYDALDQCGALVDIIAAIPGKEKNEIDILTRLAVDDCIANNGNTIARISKLLDSFSTSIPFLMDQMKPEEKEKIMTIMAKKFADK